MRPRYPDDDEGDSGMNFPLRQAVEKILETRDFSEFVDWFAREIAAQVDDPTIAAMKEDPAAMRALAVSIGRTLWNATPRPDNDFRPLHVPKPDRNAPCPCGSGQKYKRCCGALAIPDFPVEDLSVLGTVLDTLPAREWRRLPFKRMSAEEVAFVADQWREEDRSEDAALLLESLFDATGEPDERFELAFDTLMDAYLDLGREDDRERLVDRMLQARDRTLRSAALHRRCTMLADRGEWDEAWRLFGEAQRNEPENPALSHLEVIMLAAQGRTDEASERARFWAAKWARRGAEYADLVDALREMAEDPRAFLERGQAEFEDFEDDDLEALKELIDSLPEPAVRYSLQPDETSAGRLDPSPELLRLERQWADICPTGALETEEPDEEMLDAWDAPDEWIEWLAENPQAFDSFAVLDDLVTAIDLHPSTEADVAPLQRPLLERAAMLLRLVLEAHDARGRPLDRALPANRPALEMLGRLALDMIEEKQDERGIQLLEWLVLELDPSDGHGMREPLAHAYLAGGRHDEALALCARFPEESAATAYARVLALHGLGRLEEAHTALERARAEWPSVFELLAAEDPEEPEAEELFSADEVMPGSDEEAWLYRDYWRPLWEQCGALDWVLGGRG